MDEDRIERALRQGPPDEPTYQAGRFGRTVGLRRAASVRPGRRIWSGFGGTVRLAATGVVLALIVAGSFLVRSGGLSVSPSPTPGPVGGNDLLARVRSSGVLRVAIVPDYPNVQLAGGAYDGIDIDVAREIAARLGVRAEIVPVDPADLVGGGGPGVGTSSSGSPSQRPRSARLRSASRIVSSRLSWWSAQICRLRRSES